MAGRRGRPTESWDVLVIGAGLHGLVTAKTLLHESCSQIQNVTIYERSNEIGGVWSSSRIYDGLQTNSPLLTYEIPDFQYPESIRNSGYHPTAQEVNSYLKAYATHFELEIRIKFNYTVENIEWQQSRKGWNVAVQTPTGAVTRCFSHIVVCTGLHHVPSTPVYQDHSFSGSVWHSVDVGEDQVRRRLSQSKQVIIVGAGKSAIDVAAMIAQGRWANNARNRPHVTIVQRRPHWLCPRKILLNTIAFEKLLFSRFVNAWSPYHHQPDIFHRLIAHSWVGQLLSWLIFALVGKDFMVSLGQSKAPETIPNYPLSEAVSGNLHVAPAGYIEAVQKGEISILNGTILSLRATKVIVKATDGVRSLPAEHVIFATGYRLSLPFIPVRLLRDLGVVDEDFAHEQTCKPGRIHLYRHIVPPRSIPQKEVLGLQSRRIAFNGFAYSLLNPSVAFVTAHWISDYFAGEIELPHQQAIEEEINTVHDWQQRCLGQHGLQGTHIGSHATLYVDQLLTDMKLRTGHVRGAWFSPSRFLWEWFRPIYSEVYRQLGQERQKRYHSTSLS